MQGCRDKSHPGDLLPRARPAMPDTALAGTETGGAIRCTACATRRTARVICLLFGRLTLGDEITQETFEFRAQVRAGKTKGHSRLKEPRF